MSDKLFAGPSRNGAPARTLPKPTRERWQPLRSGVMNIFKFDQEEFLFEDGRLLLRGNNGAGKSRVLALQLPFLLDGEMVSHRVEPDADPAKRMEWNLLMNKHENRLGYTWIEFGRRDTDGREHYLTLGCGMHARKGTGIPPNARWFFVTPQRVGEALSLMSENRVPLNRERLEAALGQRCVYRSARDYRVAVDEALFGLGARYEPLIELLLQLRKPQIMRDFKADDLSRLLSEALPPLSPRLIENVSVSFRSLETDRQQLADLAQTRSSVETFLASYQHYVRVAVRRRAADVRTTHSRFENAQRELRRLAGSREENLAALTAAEATEGQIKEQLAATREAERTLLASPEMKSAEDLRQAAETRDDRASQAKEAAALAEQARDVNERFRKERDTAYAVADRKRDEAAAGHVALTRVWEAASMPAAALPPSEVAAVGEVTAARRNFEKALTERVRQIALLSERNATLAKCARLRLCEETRFEQRREDVARCEDDEMRSRAERAQILTEIVRGIYEWEATLEVLPLVKGEDWHLLLDTWVPGELAPFAQRFDAAYAVASAALADERSRCNRALEDQALPRAETIAALESLSAGRQPEPTTPHTRAQDVRIARAGAPLWKLCEFRDDVSAEARSGFEAALEAAGLLDAWVTPAGELIDATTHDVFFHPCGRSAGRWTQPRATRRNRSSGCRVHLPSRLNSYNTFLVASAVLKMKAKHGSLQTGAGTTACWAAPGLSRRRSMSVMPPAKMPAVVKSSPWNLRWRRSMKPLHKSGASRIPLPNECRSSKLNVTVRQESKRCSERCMRSKPQRQPAPRRAPGLKKWIEHSAKLVSRNRRPVRPATETPPILDWRRGKNQPRSTILRVCSLIFARKPPRFGQLGTHCSTRWPR